MCFFSLFFFLIAARTAPGQSVAERRSAVQTGEEGGVADVNASDVVARLVACQDAAQAQQVVKIIAVLIIVVVIVIVIVIVVVIIDGFCTHDVGVGVCRAGSAAKDAEEATEGEQSEHKGKEDVEPKECVGRSVRVSCASVFVMKCTLTFVLHCNILSLE
jgi:hypothetical protein